MRTLLLGLMAAAGVGCTSVQPTGPLAKVMGTSKKAPAPAAAADPGPAGPPTVPAVRPSPPALLITAEDVTADDPTSALRKVRTEIERDRETTPPPPPVVSVYKGGVKQQ